MALRSSRVVGAVLCVALGLIPSLAFAQGGVNSTQAEALFNQGKDLIKEKNYKEACERFAASYKLEESNDTMLALAACHDLEGKNATAWGEYLAVVKKSRGTPAAEYAEDKAKELYPRLSKLKLELSPVPADIIVKIDGVTYPKETINGDLPLDPGEHDVTATATGKRDFAKHVTLLNDGKTLPVALLMPDLTPEELKALEDKKNSEEITPGDPVKRWIGVGLMGGGVIGIVVGIVLIPAALDNFSKYKAEGVGLADCPENNPLGTGLPKCHVRDTNGLTFNQRGNAQLIPAIIVGSLGVVMATVGTILLFTSFESKRVIKKEGIRFTPELSPTYAGFGLSGTF